MSESSRKDLRHAPRVRYNAEYFGFLVGFPDGEIVLAAPSAMAILHDKITRDELAPHLLPALEVRQGFHLSTPPLAWLELTRKCNLDCPHCYIDGGRPRKQEMDAARWHGIIDEMADMGVWAVAFTGGEPTLHPAFSELVIHARERDLIVGVATHGMFLTDELLDALPRDKVIFSVSIDDLHVGRRGHDSPSELGKQAILRAQRHGFLTNIMTSTHRRNMDELTGLMDWARCNGVSVRSVPLSPIGRGKATRDLECSPSEVEHAAHFWLRECEWEHEYHRQAGLCVGVIFNYGLSMAYMTRRCSSARYLCYVASDGTLFPCTMCAAENLFQNGSVKDRPFAEVWRSDWEIRSYSWDNFAETCNGCPVNDPRYYCASRCPAMSHARNGNYFGCGASEFEKQSTIFRTALLERTLTGKTENIPVVPVREAADGVPR
jgi:radical SAM protein with 4Fe4S-binding SPASM domain